MNNQGKLFILLLAIFLILLGTSGRGFKVWQVLTGKRDIAEAPSQDFTAKNPTELDEGMPGGAGRGGVAT